VPELPEVEMVARTLRPRLVGRRITAVETSGKKLRQAVDRARLKKLAVGASVDAVSRIGKYLLIDLSSGATLLSHLGMTGWFVFRQPQEPRAPHTHVVFTLDDGLELRYADHRRFGILRIYPTARVRRSPELSILGVDPLDDAFTVDHLAQQLKATRRDVKTFLLDQTRLAGVGNIYACEALFLAGISPRRKTTKLTARVDAARLHHAIQKVLRAGIANRGTSFSDYVDAEGEAGLNQNSLHVYGREGEPCRVCSTLIRRLVQGARSTFYCPKCQR
jgi:formamidopyrimidine-DNA glycosylase